MPQERRFKPLSFGRVAVYFFFVISITSAIMETISVRSKNNSLYVIISTAPFQRGRKCPQNKRGQTAYRIRLTLFRLLLYTVFQYKSTKNRLFRRFSCFLYYLKYLPKSPSNALPCRAASRAIS